MYFGIQESDQYQYQLSNFTFENLDIRAKSEKSIPQGLIENLVEKKANID